VTQASVVRHEPVAAVDDGRGQLQGVGQLEVLCCAEERGSIADSSTQGQDLNVPRGKERIVLGQKGGISAADRMNPALDANKITHGERVSPGP